MKRIFYIIVAFGLVSASLNAHAQAPQFASQRDSLSYIFGINYGGVLRANNGIKTLTEASFRSGMHDAMKAVADHVTIDTPEFRSYLREDVTQIGDVVGSYAKKVSNGDDVSERLRNQVSYMLGYNLIHMLVDNDLTDLDLGQLMKSTLEIINTEEDINSEDFLSTLRFSPGIIQDLIKRYKASRQIVQNEENTAKGESFLKEFAAQTGAKLTSEGIAYIIVSPGRGSAKIKDYNYNMTGSYKEFHLDGREIIDRTWRDHDLWDSTEGFRIAVREAGVGATVRAVVPAKYAYKERGSTKLGILPGEYLIYEISIESLTAYKPEIYD